MPFQDICSGLATFGFQQTLRNRILDRKLEKGGELDTARYTPIFIYDTMMLPGSLAAILDKDVCRVQERITPALLHGFRAHVHKQTRQPCLLQSADPTDCTQGMVILGQGIKVKVEIETVSCGTSNAKVPGRKVIWARTWLWNDATITEQSIWALDAYLECSYDTLQTLFLSESGQGREADEDENGEKKRTTIFSGPGLLDYQRLDHFAGW